jgi:hypothetical protein
MGTVPFRTGTVHVGTVPAAPGGGYIVGSSNPVASYVPLANYRAMIAATLRWGKYPIRA